jgi:hypothetical protein
MISVSSDSSINIGSEFEGMFSTRQAQAQTQAQDESDERIPNAAKGNKRIMKG